MKILHLKDSFEPRYSMRDEVQIAMQAKKRRHDVTVLTSKFDLDLKPKDVCFFESQDRCIEHIKIIRCESFKTPFFSSTFYIPNVKIFDNYDIIHAHNLGSYSSFLAGMLKLIKKVPVILKADFDKIFYERLIKNYFLRKVVLKPAHIADAVTVFTTKEKSFLIDLGVQEEKIWVIPVGINYEEFSNLERNHTDFVTIGFLGRFTIQKGIHNIIKSLKEIMNEYPDVRVLFAGQKTDIKYAENIIKELENYDKFNYIGFVDSSKNFYSKADIILIPSLWETGSIITLEAMAAGKAVIASDISPHCDYIEHGLSGFLAKDENDFYIYCKELIDDESLRTMIGENARKKTKIYDWGNIFDKVEEMYAHVISIRGG